MQPAIDHYPRFRHPLNGRYYKILGWQGNAILIESPTGVRQKTTRGSTVWERAKSVLEQYNIPH